MGAKVRANMSNVTLYHGTVQSFAERIQREGLRAIRENAFHVEDIPPGTGVYCTRSRGIARLYAERKAAYLQAKPGAFFAVPFKQLGEHRTEREFLISLLGGQESLWKRRDAQPPVSGVPVPAVVELSVPEGMVAGMVEDEDSPDTTANLVWHDTLPASYVTGIEMEVRYGVWRALKVGERMGR
jgi:hypothetical protein